MVLFCFFFQVDHDPYGSPSLFLDATVQSVVDGGMLMCTATDMAMLSGETGRSAIQSNVNTFTGYGLFVEQKFDFWTEILTTVVHTRYGSIPLRGKYCHEMALRILLASIEVYIMLIFLYNEINISQICFD